MLRIRATASYGALSDLEDNGFSNLPADPKVRLESIHGTANVRIGTREHLTCPGA